MKKTSAYLVTGIFTLVGTALMIAAILLFGAGRVLEDRILMETYINESVQGLDVGSPVKFLGVQVGNVQDINFTRNFYELNKLYEKRSEYVLVTFELQPKAIGVDGRSELQEAIGKLTQNGLRVRLASANLTGVAYLELDFMQGQQLDNLKVDWTPKHPYIPSTVSSISRLVTSVEGVFKKLESIDVSQIIVKLEKTLETLESKIGAIDTASISDNTNQLIVEIRETNQQIQTTLRNLPLDGLTTQAAETLLSIQNKMNDLDLSSIISSLDKTLVELNGMVSGNRQSLTATLNNFEVVSASLREISAQLKQNPSNLIFGVPPDPVLRRK
ncbi:MAG: MlaD family protein [Verrucomicrobia bacterium]|nr:MlaD family protein [Verrucomicrobiota bacterium]